MPNDQTPYEKLNNANDDYHEAIDEILSDEDVSVELKVRIGRFADEAFRTMARIKKLAKEHYDPEVE